MTLEELAFLTETEVQEWDYDGTPSEGSYKWYVCQLKNAHVVMSEAISLPAFGLSTFKRKGARKSLVTKLSMGKTLRVNGRDYPIPTTLTPRLP